MTIGELEVLLYVTFVIPSLPYFCREGLLHNLLRVGILAFR